MVVVVVVVVLLLLLVVVVVLVVLARAPAVLGGVDSGVLRALRSVLRSARVRARPRPRASVSVTSRAPSSRTAVRTCGRPADPS